MAGRSQAALIVLATMLLSLLLPPLLLLSGAALALVTLRRGLSEGTVVLALAAAVSLLLGYLLFGHAGPVAGVLPGFWLPVLMLAAVLRATVSLAVVVLVAAAAGWVVVGGFYAALGDPAVWWQQWLTSVLEPAFSEAGIDPASSGLHDLLTWLAPLMPGAIAANLVLSALLALLIGRWWQAQLFNPGGFQQEFHGLRLGRSMALVAIAVWLGAVLSGLPWLVNLGLPLAMALVLQGLAVVHGTIAAKGWKAWPLGVLYGALLVAAPQVVLGLCVLALVDSWADLRARAARSG